MAAGNFDSRQYILKRKRMKKTEKEVEERREVILKPQRTFFFFRDEVRMVSFPSSFGCHARRMESLIACPNFLIPFCHLRDL